ncbi:MAG: glycosyltransferase family 9 protein [Candidatus Binatia bacterium]
MPPAKIAAERILLVLHGSIGDVTRALPLAELLRASYPKAFIAWSVEPAAAPLLEGNSAIDAVILFERRRWWKSFGAFLKQIRRHNFDLVLDLQRHLKSGVISRFSGAPHRLGFHRTDAKECNWLFNNLFIEPCGNNIAKLDHYLKFAAFLGLALTPLRWDFALTETERHAVDGHLKGTESSFAVLFVGTRWESKNWFADQIAACANLLRRDHRLGVVLFGGVNDRQLAEQSLALSEPGVVNLAGSTSLREAIGIIARAKVAVGPDTGLMHIAAALTVPVISLWGATDPARTGPHGFASLAIKGEAPCSPCYRKHCRIGRQCMRSIGTDEIATKLKRVFNGGIAEVVKHAECG